MFQSYLVFDNGYGEKQGLVQKTIARYLMGIDDLSKILDECCSEDYTVLTDDEFNAIFEAIRNNHESKPYAMCCICSFCLSLVIDRITHPRFEHEWTDYYLAEVGRRMNNIYNKPAGFNRSHFITEINWHSKNEARRKYWRKQGKENPVADIIFQKNISHNNPLKDLIKNEEILIFLKEYDKLSPYEKFVLCEYGIEGRTQEQIAEDAGYRSRTSINTVIKKVRDIMKEKFDRIYKISSEQN